MTDATQTIELRPADTKPHERIAALRAVRDETLEAFGKLIGVGSKGRMSEIERGLRLPTPEQALEIERLSGGALKAGDINPVIAAAREDVRLSRHGLTDTAETEQSSPGIAAEISHAGQASGAEAA